MSNGVRPFSCIEGERLTLRPIADRDFALYESLYGDDNILRYIGPAIRDDKLHSSFQFAVKLTNQAPCKRSFLVAVVKDAAQAAGILGITVTESKKQIEVGVIFRVEYQRQYLAFEALQILITFLCDHYINYDIIAEVNLHNRAAVWLAKRLGFEYNHQSGLFELNKYNRP